MGVIACSFEDWVLIIPDFIPLLSVAIFFQPYQIVSATSMCRLNPCQILPLSGIFLSKVAYLSVYLLLKICQTIHLLLYDNKAVNLYRLENKIKFQFSLLCNNIKNN